MNMMKKQAILVVSFGTSYAETRDKTIGAIEKDIAESYPDLKLYRAFTSGMILRVLQKRDGLHIDNVREAMIRLLEDGIDTVFVQPTHIINGDEYEKMLNDIKEFEKDFKRIEIGTPLLTTSEDYEKVVTALMNSIPPLKEDEALVLMGHGTGHHADAVYAALDYRFKALDYKNIFVGTVEGYPTVVEILQQVKEFSPQKVILLPFMVVAGDHAINDMAGDEEDSWKTLFENEGFLVESVLKGLGEFSEIRKIYLDHVEDIISKTVQ